MVMLKASKEGGSSAFRTSGTFHWGKCHGQELTSRVTSRVELPQIHAVDTPNTTRKNGKTAQIKQGRYTIIDRYMYTDTIPLDKTPFLMATQAESDYSYVISD